MITEHQTFSSPALQALAAAQGIVLSLEEAAQVRAYVLEQPLTIAPDESLRLAFAAIRAYQAEQRGEDLCLQC